MFRLVADTESACGGGGFCIVCVGGSGAPAPMLDPPLDDYQILLATHCNTLQLSKAALLFVATT